MTTLKDVVKERIFGGKVTFRSDMDDEKNDEQPEPVAPPQEEKTEEAPVEEASGEITSDPNTSN